MDTIQIFKDITGYDLKVYFSNYTTFVSNYMPSITAYYKGKSSAAKLAFSVLDDLTARSIIIDGLLTSNSTILSANTQFWDLIEDLSNVKTKLDTINNLSKWLRSSYVYGYQDNSKYKHIMPQNQTFESLSKDLGDEDYNDGWVDTAISNSVMEIDYTLFGGKVLDVSNIDNRQINITSVVDIMVGDNILGKDLPTKIAIDYEDLVSLSVEDTMEQSAEICLNVTKGSVYEFRNLGLPKDVVGSIANMVQFSSLNRAVKNNFKTDDSFKNVTMVSNGISEDVAYYEFLIESVLNNQINKTI